MSEVATVVRHSHEHWDGGGYPDGLAGEQIPLASRVILCADAFHAMRSDRPYRRGRPAREAIAELRACAGTQFDPGVVDAFVAVAHETRKASGSVIAGPRHRRLVALLTAFVIGGGSAVAAIPELRDAIRSVFGASPAPTDVVPNEVVPREGWVSFGPLGETLRIAPAADRERSAGDETSSKPGGETGDRPQARADRRRVEAPGGQGGGTLRRTPKAPSAPAPPATSGTPQPTPVTETNPVTTETNGGGAPDATGNSNGRGLGRRLPTPRKPAQPPPQQGGRIDPPALGHSNPSGPNGKAKGHSK
jgi:hypothetical protein